MAQTSLSNIAPESYVSSLNNSDKLKNVLSSNDKLYDKLDNIIDLLMDIKKEVLIISKERINEITN